MVATPITHVPVQPIQAIIRLRAETRTEQAIILRPVLREVHPLTARLRMRRRREASRITVPLAEAIQLQEANLTARRPVLTVSRRIALLREVTAHHPAVAEEAVQAVLQEVQDNLRLS